MTSSEEIGGEIAISTRRKAISTKRKGVSTKRKSIPMKRTATQAKQPVIPDLIWDLRQYDAD
ncbi:hypothetical protein [Vibrio superstes]|uniref:Uncharacterized protein n=1 Tax=Vibrio superstes NBRC 103154 TaxID=1219062 RepID=A0A511QWQ3_9VIBR|nr:hypothetical protein [Vibrio superstes]GEM81809.1 hypothetical protein VSU01S_40540 [Vibrio superstes NBRC 103154]